MEKSQILWKISDLSKRGFSGMRLQNLNLDLSRGITAITGYSGAGKTTLLNLLSGYDMLDQGKIECFIKPSMPDTCPFFIVPQDFGLWPNLSVRDHLLKVMPKENLQLVTELVNKFDLNEKLHDYPEFLSQGECSRLATARALATGTEVLLMDEPFANVDPARKVQYWNATLEIMEQRQGSIIFTSHVPSEVLAYSENIICLHEGQVIAQGNTLEVYHRPENELSALQLGHGNWLNKQKPLELGNDFFRPENVNLEVHENGPFKVLQTRFFGLYQLTTLEDESGKTKQIFHRTTPTLKTKLKVFLQFLLILLLTSCEPQSQHRLNYPKLSSWNMPAAGKKLPGPRAVTCSKDGKVVVLDDAGRILIYDQDGNELQRWSMPDTGLGHPEGATVFKDGKIAVADTHYARVVVFNKDGSEAFRFGSRGNGDGQFYSPVGITLDDDENIYVCEYGFNDRVQKFDKTGKFILSFGSAGVKPGQLQRASDMIWSNRQLFVADAVNNRIQIFDSDGKFIKILKDDSYSFYLPYDIDLGSDGMLYVVEYGNCCFSKIDMNGKVHGTFGSPGTELNNFNNPWGIAVDKNGKVFVADTANRRIVVLTP